MGSRDDIFYREYAYKKNKLNELNEQLKTIADIFNGKI